MPSREIKHLSLDEVLLLHEKVVARFGGSAGIRDRGLLESAQFRPQTGYYGDIAEMAAALFESLLMNHPFVDGNKRVAFFATDVFLRMNGWYLEVEPKAARDFIVGRLESGTCDYRHLLPWIRRGLVRA